MSTKVFKITAIVMLVAGSFYCCEKQKALSDENGYATGTIIGSYSNGWVELLVQVDKKYPIGKTIKYSNPHCNLFLPKYGTYTNMIGVPPYLPLSDFPEHETVINRKISFSYRAYREDEDAALFAITHGNALCVPPQLPLYVITYCQILK